MFARPLINLDVALLHACQKSTVVVASERIRRALLRAYDAHQVELGLRTWRSARVLTLGAYLRQRHDELLQADHSDRILLGANAQRLAWLGHSPESTEIDFDAIYDDVANAWQIVHDWDLVAGLQEFVDNDNHRLFRDWASRYRRAAERRRWLTEAELPALIAAELSSRRLHASPVSFIGFDVVPPALARLIDALRDSGSVALHTLPESFATEPSCVSCDGPEEELDNAIHWAREVLRTATEPVSIGIAIPDLVARYDRIVRQLDSGLRAANRNPDPALSPYNISGGISLANAPVVAIALRLLRWLIEPVHHSEVESLLRSPFFELEAFAAQSQNGSLPESYNAAKLVHRFGMTRLREVVGTTTAKNATLAEQILRLKSALELAGWPNASKLTSESFQAYRGFLDLLNELAAASSIVRNLTFAEGLAAVQGAARRALFAPMRPDAPLQVLGYLETAHLRFTHLWVVGLSDLNWPGPARPSVYIPLRLLRGAGVPRVDTDSELAFARRLTEHWCRAAPVVIFSNPNTVDDSVCRTSRLAGASSPTRYAAAPYPHSHPFLVRASHAALEIQDESAAGPLVVANLRHRGSQIIRDQSACPFRAFARYRLHAMQRTLPHSFFDLADRGVATHLALHGAHERIRQFGDVDELQLSTKVADAVASALSVYDHFPVSFLASEHKRLTALVLEWLYFERERLQGALIASERPTSLTLGAFEFQLQIDRIDELESGGMLVIDYKTGASNPLAVLGERPEEPQLAMYALSVANVQAIAFARVKHDDCRIVGWSNPSRAGHAATERYLRPPPPQGQTWAAVLDAWRTTLTHLSNEFMGGVADVSPRSAATCRQCDLHAVCRIRETGPAGADVLDN